MFLRGVSNLVEFKSLDRMMIMMMMIHMNECTLLLESCRVFR